MRARAAILMPSVVKNRVVVCNNRIVVGKVVTVTTSRDLEE